MQVSGGKVCLSVDSQSSVPAVDTLTGCFLTGGDALGNMVGLLVNILDLQVIDGGGLGMAGRRV
jgi:hypothetical protein